ncbi:unnamed protein product [Ambrosiozyma monospora]|uniref:Pre-mRNA-splicing factor CWC21 n=1 Tax=Ambrosiozyma monospora TaxID=43982 RepID=A0A9W6Z4E7_AMBMO|nr:unnamed protein product [Ambrosiozyma monospora]
MSYNGIGLSTARGSGTNGYVQRNLSNLHKGKKGESEGKLFLQRELKKQQQERKSKLEKATADFFDNDISEHEKKRAIEVKVMDYRETLEDDDSLDDDEIEKRVVAFRMKLVNGNKGHIGEKMNERDFYRSRKEKTVNTNTGASRTRSRSPRRHVRKQDEHEHEPQANPYNEKLDPFEKKSDKLGNESEKAIEPEQIVTEPNENAKTNGNWRNKFSSSMY